MKLFFVSFLYLVINTSLFSQSNAVNTEKPGPKVYALVIGISKYLQKDIPQLQFADRDAQVFADYLKSNGGGGVPLENIRLLVNEEATSAAVYDAIYWLKNTCKKDDVVFFYFSGHGDVENVTMYKNGFLICYDSPPNNYVNLSLSIDYLNDIANTLSAETKANVVLITDACHSGKLAGSKNKGSFLVGEQLKAVKNKEIRITACAADQLSNENADWGGGRGVFSYYLINGLKGLADREKDGIVTLDEIKTYIDTSLAKDPVLNRENIKQNPVLNGRENFVLARVDKSEMKDAEKEIASGISQQMNSVPDNNLSSESVPANPRDYILYLLKKQNLEELTDSLKLDEMSAEEIPFALINKVKDSATTKAHQNTIQQLEKSLRESKDGLKRFNGRLAVAFDEKGQQVIDQYLGGDAAELERRRYYNVKNNGYDVYAKMFAIALKLTQPDNYLYRILEVKLHYFSGVAARLKIPTVQDPKSLIEKAFAEQKKALALEEHAAYIYNELGILSLYKKDYATAEKHFLKATEIAPEWALPWSNLIGVYALTKRYAQGIAAVEKAKELQPEIQNIYVNEGILYEKKNNLLLGEELYRKSIHINSRHYFPFERLGYIYMNTTQYAGADSFFYEADIRKKGYHFYEEIFPQPLSMVLAPYQEPPPCEFDTRDIKKEDVMGNFALALRYLRNGDSALAEEKLKWVIALDRSNPLAFHYLGKILYAQKKWKEGDIIFNLAIKYHLDTISFYRYCDSLKALLRNSYSKECIVETFRKNYYDKVDDYYFLATLYDKWNHFTEAEEQYKNIIQFDPKYVGGYYKLWSMLERIGRFKNTEDIIRSYAFQNKEVGDRELYSFYKRMCERFPESADWQYKIGLFLYQIAYDNKDAFIWDKKYIIPDKNEEVYVPHNDESLLPDNMGVNLPGIKETILFAQPCRWPRTEGIQHLAKADSLVQDDDASADINQMIGDLYVWQGLPSRANAYYKVSVDIKPQDAATRLKLVDTYNATYFFQNALTQLDSLYQRKEINFPKQLLLAKYYIHSARFTEADTLLKEAQKIHPYKMHEIIDLNGRLQLLSQHPKEALQFYSQLLTLDEKNQFTMYSIARLYAKLENYNEAWKWLEASLKKGFNYAFILRFDPYMEALRTSAKWNSLVKNFTMKVYPPPAKSVLN
ncbi:MAG: tetratricopeptide repeat protein [Chitinophagaceae bacterium]|nr:tetratricopeptide repeat protein [Chitinophagaceae bacterium]